MMHTLKTMTQQNIRRVAVYCGSSAGNDPAFAEAAVETGKELARRGLELVYGGGRVGLMGAVADAVLAEGGVVQGIITTALLDAEVGHIGLTNLEVVGSMHDRKRRMAELADAFLALPGGFGTWEELFEVITWTQLGIHSKPAAVLNTNGYWDGLLMQTKHAAANGFMKEVHADLLRSASEPKEVVDLLLSPLPLPTPKWAKR
jgi:uncharacterized protein (TIGR00730 family)